MRTRFIFTTVLILAALHVASTQPMRAPEEQQSQFVFLGASTWPDTDTTRARVDVHYRIDRGFFVAVRPTDATPEAPFLRAGEILIELFDTTETSANRKIDRLSIPDVKAERDPADPAWYEGIASFTVKPGAYRIFFEATDRQSDRRYVHRGPNAIIRTITPSPHKLTLFPISAIAPVTDLRGATIVPDNFGEDLLFNAQRQLLLAVTLPDDTTSTITVDYRIGLLEHDARPNAPLVADSAMVLRVLKGYTLTSTGTNGQIAYTCTEQAASRTALVAVPLKTADLPLRVYSLDLHARAGTSDARITRTFRNVWPSMPRSLKNVDAALEALRFIASEQTLDSLQSGDYTHRRNSLEMFWSRRDPTPGTSYNEAMTEFYRRVDYARMTYGTLQETDGTRTDRGRVYILNGQPSRVDRALSPANGFTETWTYDKTKRTFMFVDERRNGSYKLVATQK